jgi:flagellar FliJ protein
MKRFVFPLKSVATVRALREQQAREAFAAAAHAHAEKEAALAAARVRSSESAAALLAERAQSFRPGLQAMAFVAYRGILVAEKRAAQEVTTARQAMEQARSRWIDARRHLQAIEKLETRARHRHRLEADRVEQAALDEHASQRAARMPRHQS